MSLFSNYLLSLALLVSSVLADSTFTNPPSGGISGDYSNAVGYPVGNELNVRWTTDLDEVSIYVFQDWPPSTDEYYQEATVGENITAKSKDWTVSVSNFNTSIGSNSQIVVFLALYSSPTASDWETSSEYFNITVPESLISKVPTSTPTRTKTVVTSSVIVTAHPDSDDGLSSGAVAGIAVGSTIGGILILGGLGALIWKRRKGDAGGKYTQGQQSEHPVQTEQPAQESKPPNYEGGAWVYYPPVQSPQPSSAGIYEAPHQREAAEMAGSEPQKPQSPVEAP